MYYHHISTIDLHGIKDLHEALQLLEKELYLIYSAGDKICRVIYGIGSGKMKTAVGDALNKNPMVVSVTAEDTGGSCIVRL